VRQVLQPQGASSVAFKAKLYKVIKVLPELSNPSLSVWLEGFISNYLRRKF